MTKPIQISSKLHKTISTLSKLAEPQMSIKNFVERAILEFVLKDKDPIVQSVVKRHLGDDVYEKNKQISN